MDAMHPLQNNGRVRFRTPNPLRVGRGPGWMRKTYMYKGTWWEMRRKTQHFGQVRWGNDVQIGREVPRLLPRYLGMLQLILQISQILRNRTQFSIKSGVTFTFLFCFVFFLFFVSVSLIYCLSTTEMLWLINDICSVGAFQVSHLITHH